MAEKNITFTEFDDALLPVIIMSLDAKVLYKNDLFRSISGIRKGSTLRLVKDVTLPFQCDLEVREGKLPIFFFRKIIAGEPYIFGLVTDITVYGNISRPESFEALIAVNSYIRTALESDVIMSALSHEERERIKEKMKRMMKLEVKLYNFVKMSFPKQFGETPIVNAGNLAKHALEVISTPLSSFGYTLNLVKCDVGNMRLRDIRAFLSSFLCALICCLKCSSTRVADIVIETGEERSLLMKISTKSASKGNIRLFSGDLEYIDFCISFIGGEFSINDEDTFNVTFKVNHYDIPGYKNRVIMTLNSPRAESASFEEATLVAQQFVRLMEWCGLDFVNGEKW